MFLRCCSSSISILARRRQSLTPVLEERKIQDTSRVLDYVDGPIGPPWPPALWPPWPPLPSDHSDCPDAPDTIQIILTTLITLTLTKKFQCNTMFWGEPRACREEKGKRRVWGTLLAGNQIIPIADISIITKNHKYYGVVLFFITKHQWYPYWFPPESRQSPWS